MPFARVLAKCQMHTVTSRIWTLFTRSAFSFCLDILPKKIFKMRVLHSFLLLISLSFFLSRLLAMYLSCFSPHSSSLYFFLFPLFFLWLYWNNRSGFLFLSFFLIWRVFFFFLFLPRNQNGMVHYSFEGITRSNIWTRVIFIQPPTWEVDARSF